MKNIIFLILLISFSAAGQQKFTIAGSGGGSGTPGGSTTEVQFNNAGAFGGSSNFTWSGTQLSVTGTADVTNAPFKLNTTTSTINRKLFDIVSSETGGLHVEDATTSGFAPFAYFKSSGINGFGGGLVGEIAVANDVLASTGGAFSIIGRRTGAADLTASNVFVVRNNATNLMTLDFAGKMSLGNFAPNAALHIRAGTAAAGGSPLQFTSGPLLTTPVTGSFGFLTDKVYFTITTGSARKEFTLNDAALTSGRVPYVTTNGRITDAAGMTFDGTGKLSTLDLTLTGLDVDASPDTMLTIEGGVVNKTFIPLSSAYTAVDSLMAGQYIPTLANVTNIAGTTAVLCNYIKVGNKVEVSGHASCTVTTGSGTFTTMSMSLPFATNFTLVTDCAAPATVSTSTTSTGGFVNTNTSTDLVQLNFYSGSGSHNVYFSFIYFVK